MWNKRAKYAGPRDLHARHHLRLHGRLHDVPGRDAEQPRVWLAHVAAIPLALVAFILHRRAHTHQLQFRRLYRLGRRGRRVPRRDGDRREAREAAQADRQRQRRHCLLPVLLGDVRPGTARRQEARGQRVLPVLPSRLLPPVAALGAPFLLVQQSLLPQERRADGGPGRPRAHEVVLGLPRSGRALHRADGRGDAGEVLLRLLGGAAGPDLHVLPLDRRGQGHEGQRLLRHRGVQAISLRLLEEQDARGRSTGCSSGWSPPSTARRS